MMTKTGGNHLDVGETAERDRTKRSKRVLRWIAFGGFIAGFAFAWAALNAGDGDDGLENLVTGPIPPWIAVAVSLSYLISMLWGTAAFKRSADEHEMQINIWGSAVGASALLLVYPPWWVLWRGGLVGEPAHGAMFLILFVTAIGAYFWKKFR